MIAPHRYLDCQFIPSEPTNVRAVVVSTISGRLLQLRFLKDVHPLVLKSCLDVEGQYIYDGQEAGPP